MEQEEEPFGNEFQLYCERGYFLRVDSDGEVSGTDNDMDPNTYFVRSPGGDIGLVRFKGIESQLYLCFSEKGKLYGEPNSDQTETIFEEIVCRSYTCYKSVAYPEWYMGINKSGRAKPGYKTEFGKKSTKFVRRRRN